MATKTNGLIYYKLDVDTNGYEGDFTKNCGLRGEEIDGNFNFLRGNDIKNVSFDEKGTIYITKYNGEVLTAEQIVIDEPECKTEYDFKYDSENGSLIIIKPNGEETVLTGFKQEVNTIIYHDYTLDGSGTKESPINVANVIKTGLYKPAFKVIDTTVKDENGGTSNTLPNEKNNKHDRYVTKEKCRTFGYLYSLNGIKKIEERLKEINSEWHVPSKEEWDEILNSIDSCTNPNHNRIETNIELGEYAGTILKSNEYWEPISNGKILSEDAYGFSVYPVGYCIGGGKKYYCHFGLSSAFWTSSVENNTNEYYVKKFEYNKETVGQYSFGEDFYLSLRLVKKFNGNNYNSTEDIDGLTVNCVHIPDTSLIWTKENVGFSQEQYDGFIPEKWSDYSEIDKIKYFVNDWNGNSWDKHEMKEGESIVLYESESGKMRTWILVDGLLVDTEYILETKLHAKIDNEIKTRIEEDEIIWQSIESEISIREQTDNKILTKIDNEINRAENIETELSESINSEIANREKEILIIKQIIYEDKEHLSSEIERAITEDNLLNKKIDDEINRAVYSEEKLGDELNEEKENRKNSEENFKTQITNLFDKINEEETNRKNEIDLINNKIDGNTEQIKNNKISSNKKTIIVTNNNEHGTNIDVNVDNNTIVINENGVLSVASEKLIQYVGENAIQISDTIGETKKVTLKINENDNIITNDTNGLLTSLELKWVHSDSFGAKDEIQLIGKNNKVISRIDVAEFIKDGILDNVTLNIDNPNNPYLSFEFNSASGKNKIDVPVKDLVDIYVAGNGLILDKNIFSVKIDNTSEEFLTLTNDGIKLSGIHYEINNLKDISKNYIDKKVNSLENKISTLKETDNELKSHITEINEKIIPGVSNELNALINSLGESISAIQVELNQTKTELASTKRELDDLKAKAITSINGVENEISVTVTDNTAVVGFAEDAYFVAG